MCTYDCMYMCTYVHTYICMYVCMYAHNWLVSSQKVMAQMVSFPPFLLPYIHTYIRMYACMYVCGHVLLCLLSAVPLVPGSLLPVEVREWWGTRLDSSSGWCRSWTRSTGPSARRRRKVSSLWVCMCVCMYVRTYNTNVVV